MPDGSSGSIKPIRPIADRRTFFNKPVPRSVAKPELTILPGGKTEEPATDPDIRPADVRMAAAKQRNIDLALGKSKATKAPEATIEDAYAGQFTYNKPATREPAPRVAFSAAIENRWSNHVAEATAAKLVAEPRLEANPTTPEAKQENRLVSTVSRGWGMVRGRLSSIFGKREQTPNAAPVATTAEPRAATKIDTITPPEFSTEDEKWFAQPPSDAAVEQYHEENQQQRELVFDRKLKAASWTFGVVGAMAMSAMVAHATEGYRENVQNFLEHTSNNPTHQEAGQ